MRKLLLYAAISALLYNCGSDSGLDVSGSEPLTDVLTLELSFGDKDLPDEYLLVRPNKNLAVNFNGDIIVGDEKSLKIFDSSGRPKTILGEPGYGPGDYSQAKAFIANDRYITGMDNQFQLNLRYHLYSSDYRFIQTEDPARSPFNDAMLADHPEWRYLVYNYIYHYEPDERLIISQIFGKKIDDEKNDYWAVIYQNGTESDLVLSEKVQPYSVSTDEIGTLLCQTLAGRKIVYSNSAVHRDEIDGVYYYSIYIRDLETGEETELKREYTPVAIPDSVINLKTDRPKLPNIPSGNITNIRGEVLTPDDIAESYRETTESQKEKERIRSEYLAALRYCAPLRRITTDGDYVFAYTFLFEPGKGHLVDLFDAAPGGGYLRSIYLPFVTRTIRDGYAYNIEKNDEGFSIITKYKIDPAVYEK